MGLKILLADDSPHAQRMGTTILSALGYEVVTVSNGAAALKRLEEEVPDLIIADTSMPGLSGFEVCQQVKKRPAWSKTPVLLAHAQFEFYDAEQAKEAGADAVIQKPFEPSALEKMVSDLLAGRAKAEKVALPAAASAASGSKVEVVRSPAPHAAVPEVIHEEAPDLDKPIPFHVSTDNSIELETTDLEAIPEAGVSKPDALPRNIGLMAAREWPQRQHEFEEQTFDAGETAPEVANAALLPIQTAPAEEDTPTLEIDTDHSNIENYATEVHLASRDDSAFAQREPAPPEEFTWEGKPASSAYARMDPSDFLRSGTPAQRPSVLEPGSDDVIPEGPEQLASYRRPEPLIEAHRESLELHTGEEAAGEPHAHEPEFESEMRGPSPSESHAPAAPEEHAGSEPDDMAWFALAMNHPQQPETSGNGHTARDASGERPSENQRAAAAAAAASSQPASPHAADEPAEPAEGEIDDVVNRVLSTYLSPNLAQQASGEIKKRLKR